MSDAQTAGFRVWIGFGAMCLAMFMAILDVQVVATSLPTMQTALLVSPDLISWIQTAYLIAEVIAIPLTGLLTRILTMRGLFVCALAIFTFASAGCASSSGFGGLIAWRVLQGFSGGVLIPLVFSAVFLMFPIRLQGIATTIGGVLAVLAPTVGPIVGGWITETWSWHWLFLINVLPGLLAIASGYACLPRERPEPRLSLELDWLSLILMAASLAALEIGLKEAPDRGWWSPVVIGLLTCCLAAGTAFVRRTLKMRRPVVDLTALADRQFAVGCWLSFVVGMGLFGSTYLMPVFLGFVRDHGALRIGEIMLVTGAAQLLTAPIAVQLERRFDARLLTACGFSLFAIGLAMSCFQTRLTDFDEMLWPQVVRGASVTLCLLAPTRLALGHLPPQRVANGSGLFNLMRNLGGAVGLALIDTVIYMRAPVHGEQLADRLRNGDPAAAELIGLPPGLVTGQPLENVTPAMEAMVRPMLEKASLVSAINEAWAMLACATLLGLLALMLLQNRRALNVPSVS